MSALSELLHDLRDNILRAIAAIERDDEMGALEELERAVSRAQEHLEELRK